MESVTRVDPPTAAAEVTRLLKEWSDGDDQAPQRLLPLIYEDLRRTARTFARGERPNHTLPPTAVVHEAWIQLVGSGVQLPEASWQSREHFLGVAALTMRRILVDYARRRNRVKRGGFLRRVPLLEESFAARPAGDESLLIHLAIDRALERLEVFAPLDARVVELRFFGGLTLEQTAEYVGTSRRTVVRSWRRAKAWLHAELVEGLEHGS